jgi:anaerobic selenocysteine-containing dehydrogenase
MQARRIVQDGETARVSKLEKVPAFCTQCRSRCGCMAVTEGGRLLGIEPMPSHPTGQKLCPKGRAAPELVYHPDRLTTPLKRTNPKTAADPGWQPIGWDEALDIIASRMRAIAAAHGAEQVAFSVTTPSGSHISDSISWIERLIRAFGSPNIVYGTEICNWHKDFATRFTFGYDIGTPDFADTDCVLLWGNNPAATWLARTAEIQKALKRGARMIVVDPRPTTFARRADQWLQVRPGTDQVLALALANLLIGGGKFDRAFVAHWTNGPLLVRADTGRFLREGDLRPGGRDHVLYAQARGGDLLAYDTAGGVWANGQGEPELRARTEVRGVNGPIACRSAFDIYAEAAAAYPPDRAAAVTGVEPDALRRAADIIGQASSVAYYAWNGVGQSVTATQTDRAIALLYALTGSYGRQGGNVPGGAGDFVDISGQDLLPPQQRAKALGLAERPLGPPAQGWVTARDVYRAVLTGDPYPVRMLFSFGTNILVSQPDPDTARRALAQLEFHVHADFFLNPTAAFADIVLPVATSWEREGLRTGFDTSLAGLRRVQLRPPVVAPVGAARPDIDIVLALARRLHLRDAFFGCDADRGHDAVLAGTGLTVEELRRHPEGIELDVNVPLEPYAASPASGTRGFPTPTRLVEIYSEQLAEHGYPAVPALDGDGTAPRDPRYPLRLGCAKTVTYCHSQHRNIASLRRLMPDPVIEMAAEDAAARGIGAGDWVRIRTAQGSAVARAAIAPGLAPGSAFGQHGWWIDDLGGAGAAEPLAANINRVIDTTRADPVSGSIPLRCTWCDVEKA